MREGYLPSQACSPLEGSGLSHFNIVELFCLHAFFLRKNECVAMII